MTPTPRSDLEKQIAQTIDKALDGDCGYGVGESLARTLMPVVTKAQAEALNQAATAIANLRPSGFTTIVNRDARERDRILWEAQRIVQRMANDLDKEISDD